MSATERGAEGGGMATMQREWMPNSDGARRQRHQEAMQLEAQASLLEEMLLDERFAGVNGIVAVAYNHRCDRARELRDNRRRMVPIVAGLLKGALPPMIDASQREMGAGRKA